MGLSRKTQSSGAGKQKRCPVCKTPIEAGEKNCSQCGYSVNRWYKKWWGVSLIALLILGTLMAIVNPDSESKASAPSDGYGLESSQGQRDYENLSVGDAASFSGIDITLVAVESSESGGVETVVEVTSRKSATLKATYFKLGGKTPTMAFEDNPTELYKTISLSAGQSADILLSVSDMEDVLALEYDRFSDEAKWSFEPVSDKGAK